MPERWKNHREEMVMYFVMRKHLRKTGAGLMAVLVAFAMLQGSAFPGRAFGEAETTENTNTTPAVVTEVTETPQSSAAPLQEASAPEQTDDSAQPSSYVFRPKVCSAYMEEVFGKAMCEAWFHLVDAVMAGEDTFACPDQYTYDWVMGQFPSRCFPVLTELIDLAYDREHSVIDGIASFTYLVPREEAAKRIEAFAQQIQGILNDALEDDYSDFEKAFALYDYFVNHYTYDYVTEERMYNTFVDYTETRRLFETGTGICFEIARAYSYLLMQAGVDAATVMGGAHEWSIVRINGVNYHVDPTFAINNQGSLAFFLMTDAQREATGYSKDGFTYISNYAQDHPHPDYTANDGTFEPLWDRQPESFSPQENILRCWQYREGWEKDYLDYNYTGY